MRVSEILKSTDAYVNVYKENTKGRFLWWSNVLPSPMRKIDVEDLVVDKIETESIWYENGEEMFLGIIARDETPSEKVKRLIPWERMDEIANRCLDGMYEAEPYEADEFCNGELDFTPYENKYFNVPRANDESEDF